MDVNSNRISFANNSTPWKTVITASHRCTCVHCHICQTWCRVVNWFKYRYILATLFFILHHISLWSFALSKAALTMCDACLLLVSSSSCKLQESSVVSKLKVHFFTLSCLDTFQRQSPALQLCRNVPLKRYFIKPIKCLMENLQTVSVNPVAHCTSFLCYYKNEMAESRLFIWTASLWDCRRIKYKNWNLNPSEHSQLPVHLRHSRTNLSTL